MKALDELQDIAARLRWAHSGYGDFITKAEAAAALDKIIDSMTPDLCFCCEGTHTAHEPDCPQRKDAP